MADANPPAPPTTPPWETKRPPRARGLLRRGLLLIAACAAIALVFQALRPQPIEVEVETVRRGPLTVHVSEEGKTRIRNRYVVVAPVGGSMQRVDLKPGDPVKAGETILTRIEPGLAPLLDARSRAQAQARVDAATAARNGALESLEMMRTALKYADANWNRIKNNTDPGTVSATDRDSFQREAEMKAREVRGADFSVQVAEFELAQAQAALLQQDSPAEKGAMIEVRAPVSGLVLRVQQESATIMTPGSPILEIGDPADLEIEAEILSRDTVGIPPNAEVVVNQWGGEPLKGRVRRIEPAAFTKVSALGVEEQRVLVLIDLLGAPPELKALGDRFRVEVQVAVWHSDETLLVPSGALFREGSEFGDWYFSGDYPTPGGFSVVNQSFILYCEAKGGRAHEALL